MTENTQKVWREAPNTVEVVGVLVENNLEIREFDKYQNGAPTGEKRTGIAGDIVIRTKENENHTIRLRQYEMTNAGKENRLYAGLVTIKNETVSIADTEKNPDLKPTRLSVRGDLRLNEYYGQDGQLRSFPMIQGTFVNRLSEDDKTENKAEFDVEGLVGKVLNDYDREGEETGRKKVSLLIPLYNSVIPVDFMVDAGVGAEYIEDNFENGSTVRIYGDMVNFQQIIKKEVEMGFGENKIEETKRFVNELLIKGGNLYEPEVHASKIIDADLVREKLTERAKHLENLKARAEQRKQQGGNSQPKTGFGFGASATPSTTNPLDSGSATVPNVDELFKF